MHILTRAILHIIAAGTLTLWGFFGLGYLARKFPKFGAWVQPERKPLLAHSGVLVFAIAAAREPFDIAYGANDWTKAAFDLASWAIGVGLAIYALMKFYGEFK